MIKTERDAREKERQRRGRYITQVDFDWLTGGSVPIDLLHTVSNAATDHVHICRTLRGDRARQDDEIVR